MTLCWICACSYHWTPCGCESFSYLELFYRLSLVIWNVSVMGMTGLLMFTQMCSQSRESFRVSQREMWWWSHQTFFFFFLKNLALTQFLSFALYRSWTLFLSLIFFVFPGLHQDPVLVVCTTQMRMSALSITTWSQQRAAVWLKNPLRYLTLR